MRPGLRRIKAGRSPRVRKKVEAFPQACSPASLWGFPRLRDLQQMAIRVVEEGPDLITPLDGRGDEHGSAGAQHLVGSRAVRHPHGQFADDKVSGGLLVFRETTRS